MGDGPEEPEKPEQPEVSEGDDDDEEEEDELPEKEDEEETADEDDDEDEGADVESRYHRLINHGKRVKAMMSRLANRRRMKAKARDLFARWMKKGRQMAGSREP